MSDHLALDEIDLDQPAAAELAGEDRVFAVERKIGVVDAGAARGRQRSLQRHRVRIAEIEPLEPFGDDDRGAAIRREIEVVGILHRDRLTRLAGSRIDRRQTALRTAQPVIVDPQGLQIPGRDDVLRLTPDTEPVDDPERHGIDDIDVVRSQVRHIDARQGLGGGRAQLAGGSAPIEVHRIGDGRHAGKGVERPAGRVGMRRPNAEPEREAQRHCGKKLSAWGHLFLISSSMRAMLNAA